MVPAHNLCSVTDPKLDNFGEWENLGLQEKTQEIQIKTFMVKIKIVTTESWSTTRSRVGDWEKSKILESFHKAK